MDHKKVVLRKLDRENLEWNAALVRPQEKQSVAFAGLRRAGVDRIWAVLDDVASAHAVDPVTVRRESEANRQATNSLCRT